MAIQYKLFDIIRRKNQGEGTVNVIVGRVILTI